MSDTAHDHARRLHETGYTVFESLWSDADVDRLRADGLRRIIDIVHRSAADALGLSDPDP